MRLPPPLLLSLLAAVGIAGCATAEISDPFPGVRSLLPPADVPVARLFIVHGMTEHSREYSDKLVATLASRLSLVASAPEDRPLVVPGSIGANGLPASINLRTYTLADGARERMRIMAVTWSPLTSTIKHQRFALDNSVPRVVFNGYMKTHIVSDGLGDAVLYVGHYQAPMLDALSMALCTFLAGTWQQGGCEGAAPDASIGFISYSLGSMMLFDAIERLRLQSAAAAAALNQTRLFFMFANQLPLLELALVQPASRGAVAATPSGSRRLETFLRALAVPAGMAPQLPGVHPGAPRVHVVAFTDPNDLLSYRLQDENVHNGVAISNVTYPVATRWFGLFADPVQAHTGYENDATIMDLVICGSAGC